MNIKLSSLKKFAAILLFSQCALLAFTIHLIVTDQATAITYFSMAINAAFGAVNVFIITR